jgi:DNA-binding beta-propeller fold protein YncE
VVLLIVAVVLAIVLIWNRVLFGGPPPPPPPAVNFDAKTIYVANGKEPGTIYVFQRPFTDPPQSNFGLAGLPLGLAFDVDTQTLYVCSFSTDQVLLFPNPGMPEMPSVVAAPGPSDVVVDPISHRVFVASWPGRTTAPNGTYGDATVRVFSAPLADGKQPDVVVDSYTNGATGVSVDGQDHLFVATHSLPENNVVYDFGDAGSVRVVELPVGHVSFASPSFREPLGLALDGTGRLFVANAGTIDVFSPPFGPLFESTPAHPELPRQPDFSIPMPAPARAISLRFDANGNLFVAAKTRVLIYAPPLAPDSQPITTITLPEENVNISGVALESGLG